MQINLFTFIKLFSIWVQSSQGKNILKEQLNHSSCKFVARNQNHSSDKNHEKQKSSHKGPKNLQRKRRRRKNQVVICLFILCTTHMNEKRRKTVVPLSQARVRENEEARISCFEEKIGVYTLQGLEFFRLPVIYWESLWIIWIPTCVFMSQVGPRRTQAQPILKRIGLKHFKLKPVHLVNRPRPSQACPTFFYYFFNIFRIF